jgi:YgiT-type zinc finger domain-containing protein
MKKKMVRKCPECDGKMHLGKTTLHFERGSFYADVENVTAHLCSRCGTRSIPGPIALQINSTVNSLFQSIKPNKKGVTPPFSGISFHQAVA